MPRVSTSSEPSTPLVPEGSYTVTADEVTVSRRIRVSENVGRNAGAADGSLVVIMEKEHPDRKRVAVCEISKRMKGTKVYCPAWMGFEEVEIEKFREDFDDVVELELQCKDTHLKDICGEEVPKELVAYLSRCAKGYLLDKEDVIAVYINGKLTLFNTKHDLSGWGLVTADTKVTVKLEDVKTDNRINKPRGFERVGGLAGTVHELVACVELPLCSPEKYAQFGVTPPRGVLLYGPPGTGKSLLASAVAEELEASGTPVHVEMVKSTELTSRGEAAIHSLFARCRDSGLASLIFIDEIDAVCPDRDARGGSSSGTESERRMVASLLTEMDGGASSKEAQEIESKFMGFNTLFCQRTSTRVQLTITAYLPRNDDLTLLTWKKNRRKVGPPLVVLGATNRPNAIDPAARRAGRFELEVSVGVPDEPSRGDIIDVILHREFPQPVADNLLPYAKEIARKTHGFVGADLKALLSRACSLAMSEGATGGVGLRHVKEAMKFVKPSALKELIVEVAKTRWSDIGGYEEVKRRLIEAVVWPITYGKLFSEMGVAPPRGILLYGPPGCSKTMLARAVATETEMNFISIKGPELFSKWVGDSEAKVRDLFRKARQAAPTVVFIDEIDAIGQERATGGGGVADRVLAQLLTELDGVSGQSEAGVILIAATNRPWAMDPALLRPGRIDRLVHVPLPDSDARMQILQGTLGKVPNSINSAADLEHLVEATKGYSGAEIVAVVREGCMATVRKEIDEKSDGMVLTRELIDEGLSKVSPRISVELAQSYVDYANKQ